ncbi:PDZ domain-containing protein [Kamptonema cortianum]|nr:PDZ domain-containing protein [Geitlerinema splendidum]MDK3156099.1 PDZ domain-containing protein [Kamptonema cortianum]
MISSAILVAPLLIAQAQTVEVPFTMTDHAIVVDSVVNGKPVSTMFDTGFSGSYILSDTLNLGKSTGSITLQDFVGTFQAETVKVTSVKVGSKTLAPGNMTIIKQRGSDYSASYGVHCDGLMGLEVFANEIFQINFEHSKFVFYPKSHDLTKIALKSEKCRLMKMLPIGNNSIVLAVEAPTGKKMYLALDTGNSFYATTHKDVLERIGMWKVGAKPTFTSGAWVASGPVDTFNLRLKNLNIYGIPVEESVWSIIDLPSSSAEGDGTVGFGFLKNFNVTIDMERRLVLLENFTGKLSDPEMAHVGLRAVYNGRTQRMFIFDVTPNSPAAKAGIREGDNLISVNGEFVRNISPDKLDDMLKGPAGTTVQLATSRDNLLSRHELERVPLINDPVMP